MNVKHQLEKTNKVTFIIFQKRAKKCTESKYQMYFHLFNAGNFSLALDHDQLKQKALHVCLALENTLILANTI